MYIRVLTILVGLLALLFTMACASESFNATQTAEAPTKVFEQAIEEQRKSVDDLPDCGDGREAVVTVVWKNNKDSGRDYLRKIENEYPVAVEINELTATIFCGGEAWTKNGRYIGEISFWVRKNARDKKGTHYAGWDLGAPR